MEKISRTFKNFQGHVATLYNDSNDAQILCTFNDAYTVFMNAQLQCPCALHCAGSNDALHCGKMRTLTISVIICLLLLSGIPFSECLFYVSFEVEGHSKSKNNKPSI